MLILQRRFGAARVVANLTVAEELYYTSAPDLELDASVGATAELWPAFHLGLEAWSHTELPDPAPDVRPFGLGPHVHLGPTALAAFGKLWWSVGAYAPHRDGRRRTLRRFLGADHHRLRSVTFGRSYRQRRLHATVGCSCVKSASVCSASATSARES